MKVKLGFAIALACAAMSAPAWAAGAKPAPSVSASMTWAAVILAFGAGGSALRRGQVRYRLVERFRDGAQSVEEFTAPNDDIALARAREVAEADVVELWRGHRLISG